MKKIAIVQSSYIPWKGYFDLIRSVDEFVLYDDVQYTKRDWRSRNQIKTADGMHWLSIPVDVKGKFEQLIKDTRVADPIWGKKHWQTIEWAYKKSEFYTIVADLLRPLYEAGSSDYLSDINRRFIHEICGFLSIRTRISQSMDYDVDTSLKKSERLLSLCLKAGASEYYSGPSARDYLDIELFMKNGIKASFFDYSGYPEYPQLHGAFTHQVSVIDLLFGTGPMAVKYLDRNTVQK